jgi:RNA polymerase sigma factor (sigma-70 family)
MSDAAVPTDRLLVDQCLAGDADARRRLVAGVHAYVRQTIELAAARWGGGLGPADVDDALQQAFVVVFAQDMLILRRWRGDARVKTYLARVGERVALRHFRSLASHRSRFCLAFAPGGDPDDLFGEAALDTLVHEAQAQGRLASTPDAEQRLEGEAALNELREAILARLSEKGRDYYRYLFVDELDMAEICRLEDTNANNVYQWKNRILREVAAVLNSRKNGNVAQD